jgi:hypothetical protein
MRMSCSAEYLKRDFRLDGAGHALHAHGLHAALERVLAAIRQTRPFHGHARACLQRSFQRGTREEPGLQ